MMPKKLHLPINPSLMSILNLLKSNGMEPLVVGGAVRDALMGIDPKDIDIEVYNTTYQDLETILKSIDGSFVDSVGKSFGIVKFRDHNGEEYDFSVPRRDSKSGDGHKGFEVEFDKDITPKEAASRRDFTLNALAWSPFTKEIIDFFGGLEDLENGILRHTSGAFTEDPLRILRGMQFSSRMGFTLAPETAELAKTIINEHSNLSKERIEREWDKLIQKGKTPGSAIQYLIDTGWIDNYPEIKNLIGIKQHNAYHPEGDVDLHTAHVMNEAARIADEKGIKGDDRSVLIYAALAHDFAKAHTTQLREKNGEMIWTAHGHEKAGGPLAKKFLENLGVKKQIIDKVVPLVENHLAHIQFDEETPPTRVKKLSDRLYPGTIEELANLIEADHSGRPPLPKELPEQAKLMLELARKHEVNKGKQKLFLAGQDLLDLGLQPGKEIGEILKQLYDLQLNDKINTREEAILWAKNIVKNKLSILRGDNPIFDELNIPKNKLKSILDSAFIAQQNNEFNDLLSAQEWVRNNYSVIDDLNLLSNKLDDLNLFKMADTIDNIRNYIIND